MLNFRVTPIWVLTLAIAAGTAFTHGTPPRAASKADACP